MTSNARPNAQQIDGLLKSLLVLARTVTQVLETTAVEVATGESLAASKVALIRLLGYRGPHTSSQAARFLGVSKAAVSQLVDSMVRSGYVVRQSTQRDGRETALRLTGAGKKVFVAIRREQRHILRATLRVMRQNSATALVQALDKLSTMLGKADGAYVQFCLQCGAHADDRCVLVGGTARCPFLQHSAKALPRESRQRGSKVRRTRT